MQDYSNVNVGDTVWYGDVNSRGRGLSETVVTKVGRKLIYTTRLVFRKDSGRTNDDYGHHTLITDLERYEERKRTLRAYSNLRYGIGSLPEGVTYADIVEAAKLLRIKIE